MLQDRTSDTIIAPTTPSGGAIGVIRLSGNDSINIVNQVFHGKDLSTQSSHTVHFGTIRSDKNQIIDEVLVSIFIAPHSYTKENVVEISCHGSDYIIQTLIQLFVKKGVRMAEPGEFTMRAYLNGQMDLAQAEAVADLIAADSKNAHDIAMNHLRGGISNDLQGLRQKLVDFASLIELELDFGEEDVSFANRDELRKLVAQIQKMIRQLMDSFKYGNAIKNGINTVIAGRPNAGKSTLLNALLNEERAIVSSIAGTTRDTIEEILNIKGIQFRLIDTAGIREAQDQIEAIGVEKTMEKINQSAILLYVFDVNELSIDDVKSDLNNLQRDGMTILVIANKIDKSNISESVFNELEYQIILTSATDKTNLETIKSKLFSFINDGQIQSDQTIISNIRHQEALQNAHQSLTDVILGMDNEVSSDFIAMDIRQSLYHLGTITGDVSVDEILGNIFGKFCIGK